ncbi:hypothetical protein KSP39_PZI004191 [Platanthera zijinensis]|uniref:Uncharacterized protein n=1 Tax=Platanthera zijinensis TaxID=2320716 RepID=A0AAP0BUD0_9ASPA
MALHALHRESIISITPTFPKSFFCTLPTLRWSSRPRPLHFPFRNFSPGMGIFSSFENNGSSLDPGICLPKSIGLSLVHFSTLTLLAASLSLVDPALAFKGGGPYGTGVTRGQDLTGKDFSGKSLIKQDFKTSILRQAIFRGAKLLAASFFDADLTGKPFPRECAVGCGVPWGMMDKVLEEVQEITRVGLSCSRELLLCVRLSRGAAIRQMPLRWNGQGEAVPADGIPLPRARGRVVIIGQLNADRCPVCHRLVDCFLQVLEVLVRAGLSGLKPKATLLPSKALFCFFCSCVAGLRADVLDRVLDLEFNDSTVKLPLECSVLGCVVMILFRSVSACLWNMVWGPGRTLYYILLDG